VQHIFDRTEEASKGKMISLATETDRTLFFDFLPLDLGTIRGFRPGSTSTRSPARCSTTRRAG